MDRDASELPDDIDPESTVVEWSRGKPPISAARQSTRRRKMSEKAQKSYDESEKRIRESIKDLETWINGAVITAREICKETGSPIAQRLSVISNHLGKLQKKKFDIIA